MDRRSWLLSSLFASAQSALILSASTEAWAQDAGECKVLEIRGSTAARLSAGDLGVTPLPLKTGDLLRTGEAIVTGKGSSVKVRYGDGSVLLIDENTKAILLATRRLIQVPTSHLDFGKVRAQVVPQDKKDPKRIYKFSVRTRAATLGVRGTDFVVNSGDSGQNVEVTTLDGVVDVGSSEEDLAAGKAVPVEPGQSLQVTEGQPPRRESVQKIDTKKWIEAEAKANPLMGSEIFKEPPSNPSPSESNSKTKQSPQSGKTDEPESTAAAKASGDAHWTNLKFLSFQVGSTLVIHDVWDLSGTVQLEGPTRLWGAHIAWTPYLPLGRWFGISGLASWMQLYSPKSYQGTSGAEIYGAGAHLLIPGTRLEASFTAIQTRFNSSDDADFVGGGRIGLKYRYRGTDSPGVLDSIGITVGGYEPFVDSETSENLGEMTLNIGFSL